MDKLIANRCALLAIALACTVLLGCQTGTTASSASATAADPNAGRLVIRRAPNLGENLLITLDGASKGAIRAGDSYSAAISPGEHVLSVILEPNELHQRPTVKHFTVQKGQTYTFTATWRGDDILLL